MAIKTLQDHIAEAYQAGASDMRRRAVEVARPPLISRKGNLGIWRQRRVQIAEDIAALEVKCP